MIHRVCSLGCRSQSAVLLAAAVLLFPAFLPLAGAQSTWTGSSSVSWGTAGNWDPSGAPSGVALTFGTVASNRYSIDLGGTTRFASGASALTFTSSNDYTFTNGTLSLANGAGMAMDGSGDAIFNLPVTFGGSGKALSGSGSGALVFNGAVTRSAGGFTITTHTVFAGSDDNSMGSATIAVQSTGILELAKSTQAAQETTLGSGDISTSGGGTLRISNSPANFSNNFSIGSNPNTIEANQNVSFQNLSMSGSRSLTLTGSAAVTFNGTVQADASPRIFFVDGTGSAVFNGILQNAGAGAFGFTMNSSGTAHLNSASSTYTGVTTAKDGVIVVTKLADGGTASSIGQATNAAANLVFDGGALRYAGTGDSTDRGFTLTNSGGTIDASGSGALAMTATAMAHSGSAGRTLTLAGSNTGNNSLATAITNGALATSLAKTGSGSWALTNNSTYTGSTTISAGTLIISGSGSINDTSGVTLNGSNAAFRYNSSTSYTQPLTWTEGRLEGTNWDGSLANLIIGSNQTISPGNSPGTANTTSQTWAGGGSYLWEMNDATGTAGSDPGWDLLAGTGTLTITATDVSQFTIYVTSLTIGNISGNAANFNNSVDQSWLIADFANPVSGFSADAFAINSAGFTNPTFGGSSFSVVLGDTISGGDNSQLYLTYTIPEPSTWITLLLGAGVLAWRRRGAASAK